MFVGWYHSHPGFACWLSGIDCNTQRFLQTVCKTFFALVVDPYKTLSNRKAEIGCFFCYSTERPENKSNLMDNIPTRKAEVLLII